MAETLKLCVSCKACRRECPTGVDMARMKIEVQAGRAKKFGFSLRDRLVGWLPRYARYAAKMPWLMNLRDVIPGAALLTQPLTGLSARRSLPRWRKDVFAPRSSWPGLSRPSTSSTRGNDEDAQNNGPGKDIVLFADTFNRYFERENLDAAEAVLRAAGYQVHHPRFGDGASRPLCCGRTFLSVGAVDQARYEAERTLAALEPFIDQGIPIVGLEPSCLMSFRDEIPALLKGETAQKAASLALTFEEFLVREHKAGRLTLPLRPMPKRALVHGHCHQKSFGAFGAVTDVLRLVPDLAVEAIESSCCGMAGAFGYGADTIDISKAMGELSLLPAVREADPDTIIVADGTSCRHQIHDGAARQALHVARVLEMSLAK
jgi:Fe-S oxidoreductase